MNLPEVYIIVLNWNGKDDTVECLASIEKLNYSSFHVVLVDNNSTDGTVKIVRELYPLNCKCLTVIETGENLGFAGGNNIGIKYAMGRGADYILLLNNDTIVEQNFLGKMISVAERDELIGITGPRIYCYPDTSRLWIWGLGGEIDWKKGRVKILTPLEGENGKYEVIRDVDYVTGCAMLVKRGVFEKIGLLDERYFLYFEEMDFCLRAKRAGFRVVFVPESIIWHKGEASSGGKDSLIKLYYTTRNRLLFMNTYLDKSHWRRFLFYFFYEGLFKRGAKLILMGKGSRQTLTPLWQGWKDFRCKRFYQGPDDIHRKVDRSV